MAQAKTPLSPKRESKGKVGKKKLFKVASEQTSYLCLVRLRLQVLICLWQDSWDLSTPSHSVVLIRWI